MSEVSTVINAAPPAAAPPAAPATPVTPTAATPAEDIVALKRELDTLKASDADKTRALQYWYQKANGKDDKPADKPGEEDVDLLDLITTKGAKGLREFLKKEGFSSKEEVDQVVNSRAMQMVKETELFERYPDLKKKDSEFFQVTAGEFGKLKKSGVPEAEAMELAAERTELKFLREGKLKTPKEQEADAKAKRETDRQARIAAQSRDRGARATEDDEGDDELSADDMAAVRNLADALDIPIEKAQERYVARAKAGVNVSLKLGGGKRR